MDFNEMDLKKLLELNQSGAISDEVLAKALNERYLKNEKSELSFEEKKEALALENRKRAEELRKKYEEKAIEADKQFRIKKQDQEIENMIQYLSELKNTKGEYVYSINYLQSLEYLSLLKLYTEIKEHSKDVVPIVHMKKDYIDTLIYKNKIKQSGTIVLALAQDENDEVRYVVYQNRYGIAGFDRINPKTFENILDAEKEYEKRVKEEQEYLEIFDKPIENSNEYSFKGSSLEHNKDSFEKPHEEKTTSDEYSFKGSSLDHNKDSFEKNPEERTTSDEYSFKGSSLEHNKDSFEKNFEERTIEKDNEKVSESQGVNVGKIFDDEVDEEYSNLDDMGDTLNKPETDTRFQKVPISKEKSEKLKAEKKKKKKKILVCVGAIAATSLIVATGGALPLAIWGLGAGTITAAVLATKIKRNKWHPTSDEGRYIKETLERLMGYDTKEVGKVK